MVTGGDRARTRGKKTKTMRDQPPPSKHIVERPKWDKTAQKPNAIATPKGHRNVLDRLSRTNCDRPETPNVCVGDPSSKHGEEPELRKFCCEKSMLLNGSNDRIWGTLRSQDLRSPPSGRHGIEGEGHLALDPIFVQHDLPIFCKGNGH